MEQGICLCPFSKRASGTFLFSWMISYQENQKVTITPNDILAKARQFGMHSTTLKRQMNSFPQNKFFSLQKRGGGYTLLRSSLSAPYLSICLNPLFLKQHTLSTSEVVLFSAILILQKMGKGALTRKALAGRTGFSLRQVCYSLQSLKKKGLLVSGFQRENYVRQTQEGRIEDIRNRRVYMIPLEHIKIIECKIAPLKDLIKTPVINNGSLEFLPVEQKNKQSDFKEVWEYYKRNFKQHAFESFYGSLNYLKKKGVGPLDAQQLLEMFRHAKSVPFLKTANKFGWQEAVVECYGRGGNKVSDSSKHIGKYNNHKPGFAWFVFHAKNILRGNYRPKASSNKQQYWSTSVPLKKKTLSENRSRHIPTTLDVERKIRFNPSLGRREKELRLALLQMVGPSLYTSWLENLVGLREQEGYLKIQANSRFMRDMIEQKIIIPLGLSGSIRVA